MNPIPDQEQADAQPEAHAGGAPAVPPTRSSHASPTAPVPQSTDASLPDAAVPIADVAAPREQVMPANVPPTLLQDGTVRIRYNAPRGTAHPIDAAGIGWDDNTEMNVPADVATDLLSRDGFSEVAPHV